MDDGIGYESGRNVGCCVGCEGTKGVRGGERGDVTPAVSEARGRRAAREWLAREGLMDAAEAGDGRWWGQMRAADPWLNAPVASRGWRPSAARHRATRSQTGNGTVAALVCARTRPAAGTNRRRRRRGRARDGWDWGSLEAGFCAAWAERAQNRVRGGQQCGGAGAW
ncbi:hypothetical protein FA95DRAFT_579402 [Auriscalpium vulgare]|uniref:Uncharacterized protein n=1 Tax=Auriscalpium vulgare TaxID=40419 RepID=A0ACB8S2X6_9AGAM|nr:hypothetical protein FA95DRAFT_579402 [Auriscalpium vulgare]